MAWNGLETCWPTMLPDALCSAKMSFSAPIGVFRNSPVSLMFWSEGHPKGVRRNKTRLRRPPTGPEHHRTADASEVRNRAGIPGGSLAPVRSWWVQPWLSAERCHKSPSMGMYIYMGYILTWKLEVSWASKVGHDPKTLTGWPEKWW